MRYLLDTNLIIEATEMDLGAVLVTRNEDDFKSVDGLDIINPWDF